MKNKSPAFQFYVDDFLAGTLDMTAEEIGGYVLLLCRQWDKGSIPDDDLILKKIARVHPESLSIIRQKFSKKRGKLINIRLEKERNKQNEWRERCVLGGKNSAAARLKGSSTTLATTLPTPLEVNTQGRGNTPLCTFHSPSPSPSPYKEDDKASKAFAKLTRTQKEVVERFESLLNGQWTNDAGKWVIRTKENTDKAERVAAEVENAHKEGRIKTTPAQYAEQIWKEFK